MSVMMYEREIERQTIEEIINTLQIHAAQHPLFRAAQEVVVRMRFTIIIRVPPTYFVYRLNIHVVRKSTFLVELMLNPNP